MGLDTSQGVWKRACPDPLKILGRGFPIFVSLSVDHWSAHHRCSLTLETRHHTSALSVHLKVALSIGPPTKSLVVDRTSTLKSLCECKQLGGGSYLEKVVAGGWQ